MKDTTVATLRTVVPLAWTAFVIDLVRRITGIEITETQALAVVVVAAGVLYRLARYLEARWPALGWILLGSGKTPVYIDTTAQEG